MDLVLAVYREALKLDFLDTTQTNSFQFLFILYFEQVTEVLRFLLLLQNSLVHVGGQRSSHILIGKQGALAHTTSSSLQVWLAKHPPLFSPQSALQNASF